MEQLLKNSAELALKHNIVKNPFKGRYDNLLREFRQSEVDQEEAKEKGQDTSKFEKQRKEILNELSTMGVTYTPETDMFNKPKEPDSLAGSILKAAFKKSETQPSNQPSTKTTPTVKAPVVTHSTPVAQPQHPTNPNCQCHCPTTTQVHPTTTTNVKTTHTATNQVQPKLHSQTPRNVTVSQNPSTTSQTQMKKGFSFFNRKNPEQKNQETPELHLLNLLGLSSGDIEAVKQLLPMFETILKIPFLSDFAIRGTIGTFKQTNPPLFKELERLGLNSDKITKIIKTKEFKSALSEYNKGLRAIGGKYKRTNGRSKKTKSKTKKTTKTKKSTKSNKKSKKRSK